MEEILEFYEKTFYPYQKKFLQSPSKFRINNKARQTGFSWAIAFEMALNALNGEKSIAGSTGYRASKKLLKTVKNFVYAFEPNITPTKDNESEIHLKGGGEVICVPATVDTIRGYTGHVYLDEVAHIKNARSILRAIAPSLTRQDEFRRLTLNSTPLGKSGLFYDAWVNIDNAFSQYERFSINIKQAIEQGFPSNVLDCLALIGAADENDEGFRMEYMCEFVDEASSYFPFELILSCVNYELEYFSYDELIKYMSRSRNAFFGGYDPAKKVDSGVFSDIEKIELTNKLRLIHQKAWQGIKYTEQEAYISSVCRTGNLLGLLTDNTGIGERIQESLQKSIGEKAQGLTYTNASKEKIITNLRTLFQDKRIEIPNDPLLISELHSLIREVSEGGLIKYHHEDGKHDDRVWSLANACSLATGQNVVKPVVIRRGGY